MFEGPEEIKFDGIDFLEKSIDNSFKKVLEYLAANKTELSLMFDKTDVPGVSIKVRIDDLVSYCHSVK